jgi:translation initiation factor IF-1
MASNSAFPPNRQVGLVEEALPGLSFKVVLESKQGIIAYLAGKLKINRIKVLPGDRVLVELSPDGHRGRIVRRL